MNIGARIKELRIEQKITQDRLSEYLGISPQAVSKWENGTSMPDITALPMLAEIFNVTADYLLGNTTSATAKPRNTAGSTASCR